MAKKTVTIAPSIVPAIAKGFDFKAFPIIKGAANIEKLIKSTAKSYTALKPKLHQALLSAAMHAVDTNDTTLVSRFWDAFGNEINKRNGIAKWLGEYTNLQYRKAKNGTMQWLKPKKENAVTLDEMAKDMPFYSMPAADKANNSAPFSLHNLLERLLTRAENKQSEGKLNDYETKELTAINKAYKAFIKNNPVPVAIVSAVAGTPEEPQAQAA